MSLKGATGTEGFEAPIQEAEILLGGSVWRAPVFKIRSGERIRASSNSNLVQGDIEGDS